MQGYKRFWLIWLLVALIIFSIFATFIIVGIWRIGTNLDLYGKESGALEKAQGKQVGITYQEKKDMVVVNSLVSRVMKARQGISPLKTDSHTLTVAGLNPVSFARIVREGNSILIFHTNDLDIIFTPERQEHIKQRHPEVDINDIFMAITQEEAHRDNNYLYFYKGNLKVVVKQINEETGKIITAHYNSGLKTIYYHSQKIFLTPNIEKKIDFVLDNPRAMKKQTSNSNWNIYGIFYNEWYVVTIDGNTEEVIAFNDVLKEDVPKMSAFEVKYIIVPYLLQRHK